MESSMTSKLRSRSGCERCKKRRQKCDEQRPICTRCRTATDAKCSYAMKIQWGGRHFEKSRFGDCQVQRVETTPGCFIYSSEDSSEARTSFPNSQGASSLSTSTIDVIPREIGVLPDLTAGQKSLLHYFIHEASTVISHHRQIQSQTCQVLLPLSFEDTTLLHAILAFSASHKMSVINNEDQRQALKYDTVHLKRLSIYELQQKVDSSDIGRLEAVLATSLMLCLSALRYDEEDYNSWRIHLEGARSAISAVNRLSVSKSIEGSTRLLYLKKRYSILELIAFQGLNGFHARDLDGRPEAPLLKSSDVFLDDYVGCSTDVLEMFQEIAAVAWERRRVALNHHDEYFLSDYDFDQEACNLEARLLQMIDRDKKSSPVFYPGVQAVLSPRQISEYILCNETFQYTALLTIRRRIRRLSTNHATVQECVKKIIQCAKLVEPSLGLSPGLGLNEALFAAGYSCLEDDRHVIRNLLGSFHRSTRNHNMILALRILEAYWSEENSAHDPSHDSIHYNTNLDFIAY